MVIWNDGRRGLATGLEIAPTSWVIKQFCTGSRREVQSRNASTQVAHREKFLIVKVACMLSLVDDGE